MKVWEINSILKKLLTLSWQYKSLTALRVWLLLRQTKPDLHGQYSATCQLILK